MLIVPRRGVDLAGTICPFHDFVNRVHVIGRIQIDDLRRYHDFAVLWQHHWFDWRKDTGLENRICRFHDSSLNLGQFAALNYDYSRAFSHIQIPNIQRVLLNELAAGFDLVAHEDAEEVVGGAGVVHADLEEGAVGGVEGGFA